MSSAATRAAEGPRGEPLREALPLDEAHREVVLSVVLADLVNGDDAVMIEIGSRLGFNVETADIGLVRELARQDHLQRDPAVERLLSGLKDDAHASAAISRRIS